MPSEPLDGWAGGGPTKRDRQGPRTGLVGQHRRLVRLQCVDEAAQDRGHEARHVATDHDDVFERRVDRVEPRGQPRERPVEGMRVMDEARVRRHRGH